MLVSCVQQSDSVIYVYVYIYLRFFSVIDYYKMLLFSVLYSKSLLSILCTCVCAKLL